MAASSHSSSVATSAMRTRFAPGLPDLTAFRDTSYLQTPLPPSLILPAGYDVRVYDNNAVDASADDMVVQMVVAERETR